MMHLTYEASVKPSDICFPEMLIFIKSIYARVILIYHRSKTYFKIVRTALSSMGGKFPF